MTALEKRLYRIGATFKRVPAEIQDLEIMAAEKLQVHVSPQHSGTIEMTIRMVIKRFITPYRHLKCKAVTTHKSPLDKSCPGLQHCSGECISDLLNLLEQRIIENPTVPATPRYRCVFSLSGLSANGGF